MNWRQEEIYKICGEPMAGKAKAGQLFGIIESSGFHSLKKPPQKANKTLPPNFISEKVKNVSKGFLIQDRF